MRKITTHIVEGDSANHQLKLEVLDEPGQGGANHLYRVTGFDMSSNLPLAEHDDAGALDQLNLMFQNGPIAEVGVNGITHEVLAAVLIDRLESFQAGPYASEFNSIALESFRNGLRALQARTVARIHRGVEGTHKI